MQSLAKFLSDRWTRRAIPIVLAVPAGGLTWLFRDVTAASEPFCFFVPAVLLSAFLGGLLPGLAATLLAVLFMQGVMGQATGFSLLNRGDAIALAVFTFFGVLTSFLCGALHRSWHEAEKGLATAELSQKRLRASQRQLVGIFRQATVGIVETEAEGRIRLANPSFCAMLGYEPRELHGQSLYDLIHPEDRDEARAQTADLLAGATDRYTSQRRYIARNGRCIWVEVTRSLVRHGPDQPAYILSIVHNLTPQKQMELAARASEARFQTLFETAPVGICIVRDGRILFCNTACITMFGYEREDEMRGRSVADLLLPEQRDELLARNLLRQRGEAGTAEYEITGVRRDGSRFPFHIVASRIETEDGPATVGFLTDVTRQHAAEQMAHVHQQRLQLATAAGEIGTWRLEPGTQQLACDANLNRMRGLEAVATELPLSAFLEDIHPADRADVQQRFATSLETGRPLESEFRLIRRDGSTRWVRNRGKMITPRHGSEPYMTGAMVDITELRQARLTLRRRERQLQTLVENIPSIIARYTMDMRCVFINAAIEAATGLPPAAFIGHTIDEMPMQANIAPLLRRQMNEVIRTGQPTMVEFAFSSPDRERYFQLRVVPERGPQGELESLLTLTTDITDIKVAERKLNRLVREEQAARQQAEAASLAKDQFLAVLSHELRTPLTPVMMTVAAMEMDPTLSEAVREDVAMIRRNVELETKLIDDLLDVTRIVNGKLRLQPQRTPLHPLIHHVLSIFQSDIEQRRLCVELELAAEDDVINGDPARLQQVLWNLIKNAVKFSHDGGRIRIRTENLPPHSFRVDVIDEGIGIEPEAMSRLFVAFEQGSPSVTRQFGGLGLGLAISKAIIDLHGGSIEAHSDGHGKGARLTVRLPTMAAIEQLVDRLQPPQTPRDARGLRVLLVEDHADTARILERYLTSVGYQVSTAGSVAAALTLASQHQFDIVVSDIGLPDATGLDLMRQLRQRCAVPGIAISGFGMDSDLRASQAAGFDVHLIKPVDPGRLHETIHQVVEQAAGTQG